jgi:hypothetical protein
MASISMLDRRISGYHAWLRREPGSGPLLGLLWEPDIPPLPAFLERVQTGEAVRPEQIDFALFLPEVERFYAADQALQSDIIQPFSPAFGIPWIEAIAGCPVVAHPGSLWAQPALATYANRATVRFDPANPWLVRLIAFTRAMVDLARGRFPVALPQMRGPLDTLAALRGPQQLSIDMVERPHEVALLLAELTDLWIAVARALLAVIPPYHGGYCSRMKMWAPGPVVTPQNDISTLMSPRMYRDQVLPYDRRIIEEFPYHCYHLHGSECHQVDNLLQLEKLTAIQFTLEHTVGGPSLAVTLPVVRRIVANKPLILVALDIESIDRCLAELPTDGLCLTLGVSGPAIPTEATDWLARQMAARQRVQSGT